MIRVSPSGTNPGTLPAARGLGGRETRTRMVVVLSILLVVLSIVLVSLWNWLAHSPCEYIWQYAIGYGPPYGPPGSYDGPFRGLLPLCLDVLRLHGSSL